MVASRTNGSKSTSKLNEPNKTKTPISRDAYSKTIEPRKQSVGVPQARTVPHSKRIQGSKLNDYKPLDEKLDQDDIERMKQFDSMINSHRVQ